MSAIMIVTGAGRGIGAAVARKAALQGYAVCVNYARSTREAEALVAGIRAAGGRAIAVQADITRDEDVKRLFATVDRELGTVNVLVNNAGIIGGQCPVDSIDATWLEPVFAANVYGTFYASREALLRMSTKHGGRGGAIVNVSSVVARHGGLPKEVHYAATKGAIDSFTIGLAKEVAREGVRVNAVRPGIIVTDIHEAHGGQAAVDALEPSIPLGRAGTPEEVADVVLWLASDAASYLQGAIIDVSGGR